MFAEADVVVAGLGTSGAARGGARTIGVEFGYVPGGVGTDVPLFAFWDASNHPVNENAVRRTTLEVLGAKFDDPVWIDLVTGAIYRIPERMYFKWKSKGVMFEDVPFYDAPAVITEKSLVMKETE